MKQIICFLAALMFCSVSAHAGWNVKQKDDGSTVWVNPDAKEVPVGDSGLTVHLEDVSTASTAYVVAHKSGNIVKAYSTIFGALDSGAFDATIDFFVVEGASPAVVTSVSAASGNGAGTITIAATGSLAGTQDSVSWTVGTDSGLSVSQGDIIAVHTDGSSVNDVDASITIVIE